MNEEKRIEIKNSEYKCNAFEQKKENIRKEIEELVKQLLATTEIQQIKYAGYRYLEMDKKTEQSKKEYETLVNQKNLYCKHPIVCLTGYLKHNNSNKIVPTTRENAEYGSTRCLECGKKIYTLEKKYNEKDFDKYIYINDYLKKQSESNYQLRPIIELSDNMRFSDLYEEYQKLVYNKSEEEIVQKILLKYKKNGK